MKNFTSRINSTTSKRNIYGEFQKATIVLLLVCSFCTIKSIAQVEASGSGFNYFPRVWLTDNSYGAGYTFYSAVWPILETYPGADNFQMGLVSTWLAPKRDDNNDSKVYNTIEGGLGWWGDTRFGTEIPKFIMGGVANDFAQWANGVGAGSTSMLRDGHRDWSVPGGKYGVAQLSQHLLWPPDGITLDQNSSGEYLGYGYHPLPLTEPMEKTYGKDFKTGNQCWTLFMNSENFKGPATFFIPTFWTETALNEPKLEGQFIDVLPSDKNLAFAIEHASTPALISENINGKSYAKVLPFRYPISSNSTSEITRDIIVYKKSALWNDVESWFKGGPIALPELKKQEGHEVIYRTSGSVDGKIEKRAGNSNTIDIDQDAYMEKKMNNTRNVAGFEFNLNGIKKEKDLFVLPEYYELNSNNEWIPISFNDVPAASGLKNQNPKITPRSEISYLTPMEKDCHLQDPNSAWRSPGPVAGPFTARLGDGSELTYYWYRFIDQPSIIHANLPVNQRQLLQERIEKIHRNWTMNDNFIAPPTGGEIARIDNGLIVTPPTGLEIGYVPIVTRQQKSNTTSTLKIENKKNISMYPNPSHNIVNLKADGAGIDRIQISDALGKIVFSKNNINQALYSIKIDRYPAGVYFINLLDSQGALSQFKLVKSK